MNKLTKRILKSLKLYVPKTRRVLTYEKYKKEARRLLRERVDLFAPQIQVTVGRMAIRNQKRSWGSCSSLGNLNFNYKLLFLPHCMRDYVVVHELCHRLVLNHSQEFWLSVAAHFPDYERVTRELRKMEKETRLNILALSEYQKQHTCSYCEAEISKAALG